MTRGRRLRANPLVGVGQVPAHDFGGPVSVALDHPLEDLGVLQGQGAALPMILKDGAIIKDTGLAG